MFGPNVSILGGNHDFAELGKYMIDIIKPAHHKDLDVVIKDDVWVGAGVIILSGVTIETGAVVAAGSVVTRDIGAFEIHGGVPNKKLKDRFTPHQLQEHKRILGLTDG